MIVPWCFKTAAATTKCDTLMLQQAPDFRIWTSESQDIPPLALKSSFISVPDFRSYHHQQPIPSCSKSTPDTPSLPLIILWHWQILLKSCFWQLFSIELKEQVCTNILLKTLSVPVFLKFYLPGILRAQNKTENTLASMLTMMATACTTTYQSNNFQEHKQNPLKPL